MLSCTEVTIWFLFWLCVALLSARSSKDRAFPRQEMIEIAVENLKKQNQHVHILILAG